MTGGIIIPAVVEQFKDEIFEFGEMNNPVDGEDGVRVGLHDDRPIVEQLLSLPWIQGFFPGGPGEP